MGLTKQYLRYAPLNIFGIVASTRCNIKLIRYRGTSGKFAAVGACEYVFIWDLKKGETVNFISAKLVYMNADFIKSIQF